jgi:hypothetical protein
MVKALLCCLLVLLTPADDAWARATPQPEDDVWATDNNDYLPRTAAEASLPPLAPAPGTALAGASTAPAASVAAPVSIVPAGPDPLYLLMSLQR